MKLRASLTNTARASSLAAFALFLPFLIQPVAAAPFKLLAIGDSLTEEYKFEWFFSAPASSLFTANTKNWVELLATKRAAEFSMGNYKSKELSYADLRNGGYEYNYGVPGFKAEHWDSLLHRPSGISEINTRRELKGDLSAVDAVLIFIGGNDLSLASSDAKNDEIRVFISNIHDYVRAEAPANLPIIIATVPDIGATPKEQAEDKTIATPEGAAAARQRVATLNANIIALGSRPNTYIARIDALTDQVFDQAPFHLNGTNFTFAPHPQNPPLHLFCKDGFHPSTGPQALIANEILKAINLFAPTPIPLFSNREILSSILGQNPDQPYLDWAGSAGGMQENPDGDALPNLLEYLLDSDPETPNAAFDFLPGGSVAFTPSPTAARFAELSVLQSSTLENDWIPVPESNIQPQPDGSMKIIPTAPKLFYKLRASTKP